MGFNKVEFTVKCIDSVFRHEPESEVIFLDNGSEDGTFEILQSCYKDQPAFHYFRSVVNIGTAAGMNYLLKRYISMDLPSNFFVFIDNDAELLENISEKLDDIFIDDRIGIVGQSGYIFDSDFNFFNVHCKTSVDAVATYFAAFHKDIAAKTHLIDEIFETHLYGGGDFDLCLSAKILGYKVISAPMLPVSHYGRASSSLLGEKLEKDIRETNELFIKKWSRHTNLLEVDKDPKFVMQLYEDDLIQGSKKLTVRQGSNRSNSA
jgi:GT2 family glycosyltransferase